MENKKINLPTLNSIKKTLIKKVEKKGIYENFGQKELRAYEDKFSLKFGKQLNYINAYDENKLQKLAVEFNNLRNWCLTYNGR